MANNLVSNVRVYGGKGRVAVQWNNPDAETFTGVKIVYKVGSLPANHTDGTVIDVGMTAGITYPTGQEDVYISMGLSKPDCLYAITGLVTNGTSYGIGVYSYNGVTDGNLVAAGGMAQTQIVQSITFAGVVYTDADMTTTAADGWKVGIVNTTTGVNTGEQEKMELPFNSSDAGGFTSSYLNPSATNDIVFPGDIVQFTSYDASDTIHFTRDVKLLLNDSGAWNSLDDGFLMFDLAPLAAPVNRLPATPVPVSPTTGARTSDTTPTFVWEASVDLDGDPVNYAFEIDSVVTFDSGVFHRLYKSSDSEVVAQFQYSDDGTTWNPFPSVAGVTTISGRRIRFTIPDAVEEQLSERTWYWRVYATDNTLA